MKIEIKHKVTPDEAGCDAATLLAKLSELPKQRIKDAMTKGAVILKRKQGKRLRRAKETLLAGDQLSLCYDDKILALSPPEGAYCLNRSKTYSVWYKPAGLMSQGTAFGDHLALQRLVELEFNCPVFLVHRLDRETSGIMLFAHTKSTAAKLSRMFEQHQIEKIYQATVLGQTDEKGSITEPLDNKPAMTHYERIGYDSHSNQSQLRIS
ncbi:MAG: RNA pseudouridine synthase, partial [Oceanospirillales bacterium]